MASLLSYLVLPLLIATPLTQAYKIDDSCRPYYELVYDSMEAAFGMAAGAAAALRDPLQSNADDQRLAQLLFNPGGNRPPFTNTLDAWGSLNGLARISALRTDSILTDPMEVVVYCNLNHVVKRNDGKWFDSDMQVLVDPDQIESLTQPSYELASTFRHSSNMKPGQITINTWFLQWAYHARYKRWNDWSLLAVAARTLIPATTRGWPFTEIDAISLLDKVLLHELTHTAAGLVRDDVWPATETLDIITRLEKYGPAYGWNRAKFLAGHAGPGQARSAQNNADSLALLGSAIRLRQMVPSQYVADNGQVVSTRPQKRFVPAELERPSSSVRRDGFVTMVKERNAIETGISVMS